MERVKDNKRYPCTNIIKDGDWVICDLRIGQISEIEENGMASFRDGFSQLGGRILDRCRPLTLRNKAIVETFDIYYNRLKEIDGNSGFNYPDISRHLSTLALNAIDNPENDKIFYDMGAEFSREASDYKQVIQGVRLFRRAG